MKFSVQKQEIKNGLSVVSHRASSRTILPVLKNILIEAQNGRIKLAATDLQVGIVTYVSADVMEEGSLTLPSDRLVSLVDSMPDKEVVFVSDNGADAKLSCGPFKATLKGIPANEFPVLPNSARPSINFNGEDLKKIIESVSFCADQGGTGQMVEAVYIASQSGILSAYATNRYRMARYTTDKFTFPDFSMTIPAKSLQEISKICDGEEIGVILNENQVIFSSENTIVVMQLVNGIYPVFDRGYIDFFITVRVNRKEMLSAVKSVNVFSKDSDNAIMLRPDFGEEDRLSVYARSAEMGDANSHLPAIISGGDFEISMNGQYLQQILSAVQDNDIVLHIVDGGRQMMITGAEDDSAKYLIVPMMTR